MRLVMPRLSVRVLRFTLAYTRFTPNQITIVSLLFGVAAAFAYAAVNPFVVLAGLLAFHVHVLLDYVDGEVARCRGETSVKGAYFDLMTDRLTFPLLVFCAGVGVYRQLGDPNALIIGFIATFGLLLDKFAVDCWYRANTGAPEIEDRYVAAPDRSGWHVWKSRFSLLAVMARGLTAFLTYTVACAFIDAHHLIAVPVFGSTRALV